MEALSGIEQRFKEALKEYLQHSYHDITVEGAAKYLFKDKIG